MAIGADEFDFGMFLAGERQSLEREINANSGRRLYRRQKAAISATDFQHAFAWRNQKGIDLPQAFAVWLSAVEPGLPPGRQGVPVVLPLVEVNRCRVHARCSMHRRIIVPRCKKQPPDPNRAKNLMV